MLGTIRRTHNLHCFTYIYIRCSFSFNGITLQNDDGLAQVASLLLDHILRPQFNMETYATEVFDAKTESGVM